MSLQTLEWANGLRASLIAEIDRVSADGVNGSEDLRRLVSLRQYLAQVESLIASLKDYVTNHPGVT